MIQLTVAVPRDLDWPLDTKLQLFIGSENAASLAASTPSGGTQVDELRPWGDGDIKGGFGQGAFGEGAFGEEGGAYGFGEGPFGEGPFGNDLPDVQFTYRYNRTLVCCSLPFGVKAVDDAGNASAVAEGVVVIEDYPQGVRDFAIAAVAGPTPNKVGLSWTESLDV